MDIAARHPNTSWSRHSLTVELQEKEAGWVVSLCDIAPIKLHCFVMSLSWTAIAFLL